MGEAVERKRAEKGTGSLRKRGPAYEYRFTYTSFTGERKNKSVSAMTIDECVDKAEEFLKKNEYMKKGIYSASTIPDILKNKLDMDLALGYTGEQGYERNMSTVALIERSAIGRIPIVEVTAVQLEYFLKSITRYSNNMIRKVYAMLKNAYKIGVDSHIVQENLMLRIGFRCPKSKKQDKKVRGMTEEEQQKFIEALESHAVPNGRNDYRLQLLIELHSGMRMGEINALKPEDIYLDRGFVHVSSTISKGMNSRSFIKEGAKTEAGVRDVPISQQLRPLLEEALANMKDNPEGLVFYDHIKNDLVTTSQVNCFFRRICEKAGIEYNGQHSLRHTFATRCIEAGIQPVVLKNWLGHTNIHITLDTYSDVFNRMHLSSINLLDEHMGAISGETVDSPVTQSMVE